MTSNREKDTAGPFEPLDTSGVLNRHVVVEDARTACCADAFDVDQILEGIGQTEQPPGFAGRYVSIPRGGRRLGAVLTDLDKGLGTIVVEPDPFEKQITELDSRNLMRGEFPTERDGRLECNILAQWSSSVA